MTQPATPIPEPWEIEQEIGKAVAEVLRRCRAEMTIKWVAIAEVMDGDGQRGLWTFASEEIRRWETIGMLQYALNVEHAETVAEQLRPDDE